jgi:hypothetical protein
LWWCDRLVEVAHGVAVEVLVSLLQCVLMHPRQSDGEAASDALEVLLRILLDGTRHGLDTNPIIFDGTRHDWTMQGG